MKYKIYKIFSSFLFYILSPSSLPDPSLHLHPSNPPQSPLWWGNASHWNQQSMEHTAKSGSSSSSLHEGWTWYPTLGMLQISASASIRCWMKALWWQVGHSPISHYRENPVQTPSPILLWLLDEVTI